MSRLTAADIKRTSTAPVAELSVALSEAQALNSELLAALRDALDFIEPLASASPTKYERLQHEERLRLSAIIRAAINDHSSCAHPEVCIVDSGRAAIAKAEAR